MDHRFIFLFSVVGKEDSLKVNLMVDGGVLIKDRRNLLFVHKNIQLEYLLTEER